MTSRARQREKGRDPTQSYDKSPYTSRNVKRGKWQHKQRHKKFDYTAVSDRLGMVSWSNYGHPTGVVTGLRAQPSYSPQQPCNQKDTHLKNLT